MKVLNTKAARQARILAPKTYSPLFNKAVLTLVRDRIGKKRSK